MSRWIAVAALLCAALACKEPALKGRGEACQTLSECEAGLACVEGACGDDLSGLAESAEPPPFLEAQAEAEAEAQAQAEADAGADSGAN